MSQEVKHQWAFRMYWPAQGIWAENRLVEGSGVAVNVNFPHNDPVVAAVDPTFFREGNYRSEG